MPPCPFCQIPRERIVLENDLAFAIRDGYPISPGHTLVIPKRHVGPFFKIRDDIGSTSFMSSHFA